MKRWKVRPDGSNWGDFGDDDQLGRLNLLDAAARRRGIAQAREGIAFTLSLPLDYPGGSVLAPNRRPPVLMAAQRTTGGVSYNFAYSELHPSFQDVMCDDAVLLYTQYSTQWDALAHFGAQFDVDGTGRLDYVYYNGFRAGVDVVGPSDGAPPHANALGIDVLAMAGMQGRGVLVDFCAEYGTEPAKVGYDGLMRMMDRQKVEVGAGDFLCLYTGYADLILSMNKSPDAELLHRSCAALDGADARLLQWITDSGLVAICADNLAVEAVDIEHRQLHCCSMLPLHHHCLFKLGIPLGELWYFGDLAKWLRQHGRNQFLLTAPPLRLPGSVGSPVTPIATV